MKNFVRGVVFFCLVGTFSAVLSGCGGSDGGGSSGGDDQPHTSESDPDSSAFNSEQLVGSFSFGFESPDTDWYSYGVTTAPRSNYARSGSQSLGITQRQANYYGAKHLLHQPADSTLEAGQTYIIRGYLKQPDASESLSRTYTLSMITGTTPDYTDISRILVNGSEWHLFRGYFTPTSDQLAQDISLLINSDGTEDFYIDDISLSETRYTPNHQGTPIKASGNQLVDATGKSVRLRGINLIAYADDETEAFERWQRHSYFNVDRQDFHDIKAMGFNSVRLAIWYHAFESDSAPGVWLESGFNWLNIMLGWAKEAGLQVVLDMHAPQGGGFQGPGSSNAFWSSSVSGMTDFSSCGSTHYKCRYISLWQEIARRYQNDAVIAGFDLINEPSPPAQADYTQLMKTTIDAIRQVDGRRLLIVEQSFASDNSVASLELLDGSGDPYDSNLAYDIHIYDPWDSFTDSNTGVYRSDGSATTGRQELLDLIEEHRPLFQKYPFSIGEFGQKNDDYFSSKNALGWINDLIDLLDERHIGYQYFSYKGNDFGLYRNENSFSVNSEKNTALVNALEHQLQTQ